jgi:hypothetical protein
VKEKFLNSKFHQWLLNWKPIPLCWWFIKHNKPIPKYLIGHGVYTINQASYRFRNDDGSESTATWKAAENAKLEITSIAADIPFRLRVMVQETGGETGTSSFKLQRSVNGGAYADITTTSTYVRVRASANVTDGAATTNQIGGTGTFNGGQFRETITASTVNHTASGHSEHEYSCILRSADYALGDNVKFRLIRTESGNPPSIISQTPEIFGFTPISSIEDLDNIRNNIGGSSNIIGSYRLTRDLDFNDDDSYDDPGNKSDYTTGAGWVPLGQTGNPWFNAHIDGDGHTISNLMVESSTTGQNNAGLIGVADGFTVENLGLINPQINANATNTNITQVGALVMGVDTEGTCVIRNCFVRGGKVVGSGTSGNNGTGALVGIAHEYSTGTLDIQNCYAEGTEVVRNGTGTNGAGGLVGLFNLISSSGASHLNIVDCYAACTVTGGVSTNLGGLLGQETATNVTTTGSKYDTTVGPSTDAGNNSDGLPTNLMQDIDTYIDPFGSIWDIETVSNYTNETWFIDEGNDYPRLFYEDLPTPPAGTVVKTKVSGTFETMAPKVKIAGSFVEIDPKVKISGDFQ